jgi:DnaK suppressor protein
MEIDMNPDSAHVIDELNSSLLLRRRELAQQLHQRLHQADEQQQMALFNSYAIDADQAEACQLSDTDIALLNHELMELRAVDEALERVRAGSYGTCVQCGAAIAAARLRAEPSAQMCVDCQTAVERSGRAPG